MLSLPEHRRARVLADGNALASGVVQDTGPLLHGLLRARGHGGVLVAVRLRGRPAPAAAAATAAARQAVLCTCQSHSIHSGLLLTASSQHIKTCSQIKILKSCYNSWVKKKKQTKKCPTINLLMISLTGFEEMSLHVCFYYFWPFSFHLFHSFCLQYQQH